jgi:hypothetical protein
MLRYEILGVLGKRLMGSTASGWKPREDLNGADAMAVTAAQTGARRRGSQFK